MPTWQVCYLRPKNTSGEQCSTRFKLFGRLRQKCQAAYLYWPDSKTGLFTSVQNLMNDSNSVWPDTDRTLWSLSSKIKSLTSSRWHQFLIKLTHKSTIILQPVNLCNPTLGVILSKLLNNIGSQWYFYLKKRCTFLVDVKINFITIIYLPWTCQNRRFLKILPCAADTAS